MPCNTCNLNKPIVNVKYSLCSSCNSVRLTGHTPEQRQAQSALKYQRKALDRFRSKVTEETKTLVRKIAVKSDRTRFHKNVVELKRTPVRQQTRKESGIKSQLSIVKRNIELEAVQNNEYYCKGCGCSHIGLDKSHILSVGQFKHLELVKENIQLLCRDCHKIWESSPIEQQLKLHCFIDNIIFIYFYDKTTYNKFITRIKEYKTFLLDEERKQVNAILEEIKEGIELAG